VRLRHDDMAARDPVAHLFELGDVVECGIAHVLVHGKIVERNLRLGLHGAAPRGFAGR